MALPRPAPAIRSCSQDTKEPLRMWARLRLRAIDTFLLGLPAIPRRALGRDLLSASPIDSGRELPAQKRHCGSAQKGGGQGTQHPAQEGASERGGGGETVGAGHKPDLPSLRLQPELSAPSESAAGESFLEFRFLFHSLPPLLICWLVSL